MIINDLRDIEIFLNDKLKDLKNESFLLKAKKSYQEDEVIDFDAMIEDLAEVVEQHLVDEDFEFGRPMPEIDEKQLDAWLCEYELPEPCCDRCGGRGCNYCLMCSY